MTATLTLTYRQHFSHSMIMIEFPLHYSGADTRASDNSDMNPFMLAIEKGHSDVVKMMMEKDPTYAHKMAMHATKRPRLTLDRYFEKAGGSGIRALTQKCMGVCMCFLCNMK